MDYSIRKGVIVSEYAFIKNMKNIFTFLSLFLLGMNAYCQSGQSGFKSVYISKIPQPQAPANLVITDITFSDSKGNNNKLLDVNESAEIKFTLSNAGKGDAYNLVMEIQELNTISGIQFSKTQTCDNLTSGVKKTIIIPLFSTMKLETGKTNFKITIKEGNHFDADPFFVSFNTQKFKNPQIAVADYTFTNKDGEGKIKLGQTVNLKLIIQNQGQGYASDVNVSFKNPENVYPGNETSFYFKSLEPNKSKIIIYEFFANKQYSGLEIPIQIIITESYGKYGETKTMTVSLEQTLSKTQQVDINAQSEKEVKITEVSLLSDVDRNIPENNKKYQNRFALIIGNEDYTTHQPGLKNESNVEYARNDAKVFKEYCEKTMGVPAENITYLSDATASRMNQGLEKMNKLMKADSKLEIIFYYAGHGFPDENKNAYIIPVDVNGNDLQSGAIKLNDVYRKLTEYPSERVTIFLDACFSGGGRNQGLVAARGINITPRADMLKGNIVVFSASSGDQISLPYKEKQHGMFTYFLLKKIQETKGEVTYKELSDYFKKTVNVESIKKNNKEQNPQTNTSSDVTDVWEKWKIK